ncbi:MAG: alkaline phosphatase, partial [Microbacterium sp.]
EGGRDDPSLTIVTNALNIAYELAIRPQVKIVLTGGAARPQTFELVGPIVDRTLSDLVLDWAFIGVDGVHAEYGATTLDEGEAHVNRGLAKAARTVVVAADASKMDRTSFARILELSEIDILLTDASPGEGLARALDDAGVRLLLSGQAD